MQVHQVVSSEQNRHEIDPRRGIVLRKEKVLSPGGAAVIASPEFGEYEADEHGTFDVPDELGQFLCSTPGWFPGPNPFGDSLGAVAEVDEDAAEAEVEKRVEARLKQELARQAKAAEEKAKAEENGGKPKARRR